MKYVIAFGFGAVAAFMAYHLVVSYWKADGETKWEKWLATARDSATVLIAKVTAFFSGIVGSIDDIAGLIGGEAAQNFVSSYIAEPKKLALVMLGISLLTYFARTRRGSDDPV